MILNKNTRNQIKAGSILKFSESESYIVTLAIEDIRGHINLTLQDLKTKQYIYMMPISKYYGAEIIETE